MGRKHTEHAYERCRISVTKPLHSPHVTVWCGFTKSFLVGRFFFDERLSVLFCWKNCPAIGKHYFRLLCGHFLSALQETDVLSARTFMHGAASPHIVRSVKTYFLRGFGDSRVIS
ncbi:hypothetical protein AVEN_156847-1 [Araneus ventricosus]|uniref:Uncharacterized protein n=1 Tax=Araneus ventricosus TaxID=182803 RepID=A0A4Y2GP86_ARAVE|nr:hypothetical protein AVEN_196955-1 [Araneus ventricosus]GBM55557.1 hypothetical protein AVEN_156847-1 [Araneus ventricosus]